MKAQKWLKSLIERNEQFYQSNLTELKNLEKLLQDQERTHIWSQIKDGFYCKVCDNKYSTHLSFDIDGQLTYKCKTCSRKWI